MLALIMVISVASFLSYLEHCFMQPVSAMERSITAIIKKPPKIKIGLYSTDDWVELTTNYEYQIKNGANELLKTVNKNEITHVKYDKKQAKYFVEQGDDSFISDTHIRIIPKRNGKVITINNYENRPAWNLELNDNQFKGRLIIKYSKTSDATWVVNRLSLENYVKGVAEASNDNDRAYLRALYTAARTYAYYHYLHPTKYANEPYLLTATANDQVYKGWAFTLRSPNVNEAVRSTRGKMITYSNDIIVASYFSQSDGHTRSWSKVWGGSKDYAVSVDDPGCNGDELLGHGVGLSAKGARYFAESMDWSWKRILKYYYTGVKIKSIYK
ncbi:MAG: SpoIID/LytB domain-containing protein [Patescibacteria group bacterium]